MVIPSYYHLWEQSGAGTAAVIHSRRDRATLRGLMPGEDHDGRYFVLLCKLPSGSCAACSEAYQRDKFPNYQRDKDILYRYQAGEAVENLADDFGMTAANVYRILGRIAQAD